MLMDFVWGFVKTPKQSYHLTADEMIVFFGMFF